MTFVTNLRLGGLLALIVPQTLPASTRLLRLYLTDKQQSGVCAFSARTLARREAAGIALDSLDYEVSPLYLARLQADDATRVLLTSRWLNTVVVSTSREAAYFTAHYPFVSHVSTLADDFSAVVSAAQRRDDEADTRILLAESSEAPLEQCGALTAFYEAGCRGNGKRIAVLDGGFRGIDTYPWLYQRVVGGSDLCQHVIGGDNLLYSAHTHGSQCLAIMASPPEYGIWGTAEEAEYYLLRTELIDVECAVEEDLWVAGAEEADSIGADLISSSLGYWWFDGGVGNHSAVDLGALTTQISRGAAAAVSRGLFVCQAAGNEGNDAWRYLMFPADVAEVLTVGAVDNEGNALGFTSVGFLSPYVKPDVAALGAGCITLNPKSSTGAVTYTAAGTSYATPLVAGLVASLWGAVPSLSVSELLDVVRTTSRRYYDPDERVGYGVPDFAAALVRAEAVAEEREVAASQKTPTSAVSDERGEVWYDLYGRIKGELTAFGYRLRRGLKTSFHAM